jgi:hypothetical protein
MDEGTLPSAKSAHFPGERDKLRRIIESSGLCGLANDTKWDEFITAIRSRTDWRPSYRYKCIDGPPSSWDVDWFYHLPFPMMSVEWLDIAHLQEVREHRLPPRTQVIAHSGWIIELLRTAGLDYRLGASMIRVFGYSPRDFELFDQ